MLSIPVYNPAGEKVAEESIDPADFGGAVNKQLLHDVVLMHLAARRVGTVNTRGRADVAGSGKKLFRQKGTGNARAGSKRTNKRVGGGVAFARRNRDYRYSMPKKAVRAAIRMALLSKFQDGQAIVIDGLVAGEKPKTKLVVQAFRSIRRPDLKEAEAVVVEEERPGPGPPPGPSDGADDPRWAWPEPPTRSSIGAPGTSKGSRWPRWPSSTPTTSSKQRYLVLTREALQAVLKERVKHEKPAHANRTRRRPRPPRRS